ncbi:MAG: 16S rRNA (adenine(1518)-N(6)/adenine(1519)-N(6))-dimethyltransferase RsmA [Ruminococcaceae bacterium]|nr:16S rRNA (adenine(1518)-N(6)/adenine(1519)-N(6))-dimethyltransferase RsmA [Oscillospiraceae bacterium]
MNPLSNPKIIKHIMQKNGLQFNKRYGQNFLTDESVLQAIAEGANITDKPVLEIGPGLGTLTWELASRAEKVVSVEIDKGLTEVLADTLQEFDNVTILHQDILKTDLQKLIEEDFGGTPPTLAANLPYYITTPIIMYLLESEISFPKIVIMIQKEVAERIAAKPGGKDYGVLTIAVNFYAHPEIICHVPAESFVPAPNVDSIVLSLTPRPHPTCKPQNQKAFFTVVKAAFAQRRKTLLNSFCGAGCFKGSKQEISDTILQAGIDPGVRGEALSMEELCTLSDLFCKNNLI